MYMLIKTHIHIHKCNIRQDTKTYLVLKYEYVQERKEMFIYIHSHYYNTHNTNI